MHMLQNLLASLHLDRIASFSRAFQNPYGLFALLVIVVAVLYGLSVGKTKALVSLLSIYVAYMLTALFPFSDWLQRQVVLPENAPVLMVLVFAGLYIATFLLLSHSMMKGRLTLGEVSLAKVLIISVVQLGLLASITASLLPDDFAIKAFGPAYPYLAGELALWAWAISSLLILPFMKGHKRE